MEELSYTPPELRKVAENTLNNLLPKKSRKAYEKESANFDCWCKQNNVVGISENVLLAYFDKESKVKKASSLWSKYSMLKACLNVYKNIDISQFSKLIAFLKRLSEGYQAKKSKILEIEDINRFIKQADVKIYLAYMMLDTDEGSYEKDITAKGLLNIIETLLTVLKEQPEVLRLLEPTVLQVVAHVLQNKVQKFYEKVLALIYDLTSKHISPDMWRVFELLCQVFMKNALEHFTDMMPSLHNYITVDTEGFLADEKRLLAIYNMCKEVLSKDCGENPEYRAAKLLEVILLQCRGRIDGAAPLLVELAASRLLREIRTSELRTMCLQVLIAVLYYNPQLLFSILDKLPHFTSYFIKQWLDDADCFLGIHDCKMCVLGLCTLISMPGRPAALLELAPQVVPAIVLLFAGLKHAQELTDEEEESKSDDGEVEEVLSSDEDEIYNQGQNTEINWIYMENLANSGVAAGIQIFANIAEEEKLEKYTTPLDEDDCDVDEYLVFQEIMQRLQSTEPEWYQALTGTLTEQQNKALMEINLLADQRKAARESKKIEQQRGYVFTQQTVPTTSNFGGGGSIGGS